MACHATLALGLSLCQSCILGKTVSLFLAYRMSKSKTRFISFCPLYWKIIVLISVLVEIGVCTAYLLLKSPRVYKNMEGRNVKIILECDEGSIEFLCFIFGIAVFLSLICFLTTMWLAGCLIVTRKENASPLGCWSFSLSVSLLFLLI